jgi:CubicO group peptidase (beta-lactamase class C family)
VYRQHFQLLALPILAQLLVAAPLLADPVDEYVRGQMKARHIPGLVLVVEKGGKAIKQQPYGLANIELGAPTSMDSVFPLASVTKIFTATAMYLLVQEHKLRLDDRVTKLLPGLPAAWNKVTVLNCLSHTSGIPDIFPGSPAAAPSNWIAASTQEEALKKAAGIPLVYEPGDRSSYNQTEFLLLKMIAERISGQSLEELLSKRVFEPLGMTSARYGDSLDVVPNRVALYMNFVPQADRFHVERRANGDGLPSADGKLWNNINFLYPAYQHGGVGLNMNALDLAAFDRALGGGRVLDRPTLQLMWTSFRLNNGRDGEFAGGWDTDEVNGHRVVFHIGAGMVEYAHLIDADLTVILLTNNQGFNPYGFTIGVMGFFAPEVLKRKN